MLICLNLFAADGHIHVSVHGFVSQNVHSWQHPLYVMCLIFYVLDTVQFRVTSYLEHMLEAAYGALEGLNKQAFMTELVRFS